MSAKGQLLQDPFLNALRKEHVPVSIYLVNGIKLQGQIESFDQYVVLAEEHRNANGVQARDLDRRARASGELVLGARVRRLSVRRSRFVCLAVGANRAVQ